MNQSWPQILSELASQGLNLYGSTKVSALPEEIRDLFTQQGIALHDSYYLAVLAHGGRTFWEKMRLGPLDPHHPVDTRVVNLLRQLPVPVQILYPRSPYLLPLQRLGRFLNLAKPSLIGIDINPDYGLWFAYRAVLLSPSPLPLTSHPDFIRACETCVATPCKSAGPATGAARLACPAQANQRYGDEQLHYHNHGVLKPS